MTELLVRSVPFEIRAADSGDGLTLEGYAAVFDTPTSINSHEGQFTESIKRGAFRKTLGERTPVLQFDHGYHPLVGSLPIGSIEALNEDKTGLYVRARLHDNWLVHPVRDAIESGSIDGMSFRFQVMKDEWLDAAGNKLSAREAERLMLRGEPVHRVLGEVRLFELGPVVFPAYETTSVGVRSELAAAITDPQFRADLARLLVGTRDEMREPDGGSIPERAAEPEASEPREHSPQPPSVETLDSALRHAGVIK